MAQISMRLRGDERGFEKVKSAIESGTFRGRSRDPYLGYAVALAEACPDVVDSFLKPSS